MRDISELSADPVVIGMARDILDELGADDGALALAEDGVDGAASFTYLMRGGDTDTASPEDILPAVVLAFEELVAEDL